jgi:hypothetical protein
MLFRPGYAANDAAGGRRPPACVSRKPRSLAEHGRSAWPGDEQFAGSTLGVVLPADYRAFMVEQDGREVGETLLSVHSLAEMVELNRATQDLQRAACPGLVYFASDSVREGFGWDYRQDPPPVVMVDITVTGWPDALVQASDSQLFWSRSRTRTISAGRSTALWTTLARANPLL